MSRFTVPIADILGTAFYHYELTSSTYNPTIDTSFTITCKVTNVFGNNVSGKSITLYKDGTSVSSSTTNSSGVATWTVTLSDWNVHHFSCNGATMELQAKGLKQIAQKTNNVVKYTLYADGSSRICVIKIESTSTFSIASGEQYTFTGLIPSQYAPKHNLYADVNRNANVVFYCWTGGSGGLYNRISTTQTNQSVSGQITYSY